MYSTYLRLGLHVADSDRAVVRAARKKIKRGARTSRHYREERHKFYRIMLKHHGEARGLFRDVMYGDISE